MAISPLGAASAYANVAALANRPAAGAQGGDAAKGGGDFAEMVRDAVASVVDQGNRAEAAQSNLLAGGGDVIDVVTAVSEAEVAMQTMVSIRDRVVAAYEEIMRMPV